MHAPRTKLFQLPADSSSSSIASPDRSPLSNILSSVAKHRERRIDAVNRRIRRDRRLPSRSGTQLTAAMTSTSSSSGKARSQAGQSNEENMRMENVSRQQKNYSYRSTKLKHQDALYLVIVNDPEDDPPQSHDMEFDNYSMKTPSYPGTSKPDPEPPAYSEKQYWSRADLHSLSRDCLLKDVTSRLYQAGKPRLKLYSKSYCG